jgi:hypothetical protein
MNSPKECSSNVAESSAVSASATRFHDRILRERLIDTDRDGLARAHRSVNEVGRDQLLGDILWHQESPVDCDAPASLCFGY